jgi:hypothetical protein
MGPRVSDMELKHRADIIVTIRAGFYFFEMANPRHEHEWRVWEHVTLPDDKVLIPGCIKCPIRVMSGNARSEDIESAFHRKADIARCGWKVRSGPGAAIRRALCHE